MHTLTTPATSACIKILLVDDHVVVREGLRMLLEINSDLVVVGGTARCGDALEIAAREHPAIVLLDLDLGAENGVDIIPGLTSGGALVLVLTGVRDEEMQRRAVVRGASGVVRKDQAAESLVKAVRCVHAGEVWLDRELTASVFQEMRQKIGAQPLDGEAARMASLTPREREIVGLVAQGHGTHTIADMLFISEKTVRNHLASIYEKLHVSERLELALYATKHGLTHDSRG
jgi:two-component system, NarL family, nitrate/nitrite response regulator NarL